MNLSLTSLIVSEPTFIVEKKQLPIWGCSKIISLTQRWGGAAVARGPNSGGRGGGKSPGLGHKILNIFYLF